MKNSRHEKILELINKRDIETQEELASLLNEEGFEVTQATVSRDIKKLNLVKVKANGTHQKYMASSSSKAKRNDRLDGVLSDAIVGIEDAQNLIVVKTAPGMAMAVAAALDALNIPEIIGSIAGDDTIMCATKDAKNARDAVEKIRTMI